MASIFSETSPNCGQLRGKGKGKGKKPPFLSQVDTKAKSNGKGKQKQFANPYFDIDVPFDSASLSQRSKPFRTVNGTDSDWLAEKLGVSAVPLKRRGDFGEELVVSRIRPGVVAQYNLMSSTPIQEGDYIVAVDETSLCAGMEKAISDGGIHILKVRRKQASVRMLTLIADNANVEAITMAGAQACCVSADGLDTVASLKTRLATGLNSDTDHIILLSHGGKLKDTDGLADVNSIAVKVVGDFRVKWPEVQCDPRIRYELIKTRCDSLAKAGGIGFAMHLELREAAEALDECIPV